MKSRFYNTVSSVVHLCSGFGSYFMHLQSRCFGSGHKVNCGDTPHVDEAKQTYKSWLDSRKHPPVVGM